MTEPSIEFRVVHDGDEGPFAQEFVQEVSRNMPSLEQLDDETLLELSRRSDELGVLSVYVHDDPSGDHNATAIDLKNRYRDLQRNVEVNSDHERPREVARALERVASQVEALTSTRNPRAPDMAGACSSLTRGNR